VEPKMGEKSNMYLDNLLKIFSKYLTIDEIELIRVEVRTRYILFDRNDVYYPPEILVKPVIKIRNYFYQKIKKLIPVGHPKYTEVCTLWNKWLAKEEMIHMNENNTILSLALKKMKNHEIVCKKIKELKEVENRTLFVEALITSNSIHDFCQKGTLLDIVRSSGNVDRVSIVSFNSKNMAFILDGEVYHKSIFCFFVTTN